MREPITEEMKVHEKWYEEADGMTLDKLPEFLRHLTEDYEHDYGTICHAIAASALAAAHAVDNSEQGGITGFQAGWLMWQFIRRWNYKNNECGMRLLDYDDLLYPQYDYKFSAISKKTFEKVQEVAKKNLSEEQKFPVHPDTIEHWKKIVNGEVPFGLKLYED